MARSFASSSARPGSGPAAAVPRVYLDYAGFSPVDPRVVAVMRPFLEGGVGNPGAPHSLGLEARASLDGARAKVARLIGGTPSGVIFTASATEANNLAIKGVAARAPGRHIVTSAIEHVSVINACRDLEKQGFTVTYVPVDAEGRADPDAVARWIRDDTAVVSPIASNGAIGTPAPISAIGRLTREPGLAFHRHAVGAAGAVPPPGGRGPARRLPPPAALVVPGVKAAGVLPELDPRGIAASSGSACNALTGEPSHVLRAIGCDREALEGSLCFTLGRWTTASEIDVAVETLPAVVARLRRLAPR